MRGRRLVRLSPVDLVGAVARLVESGTGTKCVTTVREDEASPFFFVEFAGTRPVKSRTMFLEDFTCYMHAVSAPGESQMGVLQMVADMEEAMEAVVTLPAPFHVAQQTEDGVQRVMRDPSGEWHAVVSYTIRVSYGLKIK